MLSIKLARNTGFCSGVRRAINIAEKTLSSEKNKVYSLGQIIHNHQVINGLKENNLCIVNSLDNVKERATVILPSHGSPKHIRTTAKKKKLKLIDVTCPYVSSVQRICSRLYGQGFKVVIIGDEKHPEIRALLDLAPGARVIDKAEDIKDEGIAFKKIGIISQTTQAKDKFFLMVSKILEKNPEIQEAQIFNTICLDTANRQKEARKLAKASDVLLVIGSKMSANTKRLFSIGQRINKKTYLVEKEDAPLDKILKGVKTVGIISGASAPDWLVKKIIEKIRHK
jgi:4-hydroxy-3-methylbut-2-enyl diphosphate reductase